ncbi:MAG: diiron oxygenase [Candidatus Rokuibacteriota bacterium]
MSDRTSSERPAPYKSKLRNWDRVASVRITPRRVVSDDEPAGKLYFSPDLAPNIQHPLVRALGPQAVEAILVRRLYRYLDFTVALEQNAVNPIVTAIGQGTSGLDLPQDMVFDAFKIYCDEAYHALFCLDLKHQVEARTGVAAPPFFVPAFARRLDDVQSTMPGELRELVRMSFAIISETAMAALLSTIPRDERVVTAVRKVIADHAEDESRHQSYFSRLLEIWWPRLTRSQQASIGPHLPQLIFAYLEPDYGGLAWELSIDGLSAGDGKRIVEECFPRDSVVSRVRANATATLRLFERCAVLDDPRTADEFHRCGLVG